jgi:NADH:ubiquinone oxidoreductase subunit F (NADH-binding)
VPPCVAHSLIMAAKVIAALYRCTSCGSWWVCQQGGAPQAHLILQLVEGQQTLFAWEKYGGWQEYSGGELICPQCGQQDHKPLFSLSQQFTENSLICANPKL